MRLALYSFAIWFSVMGQGLLHAQDAAEFAAQRTLRSARLSQEGEYWILDAEQDLRRQLEQLPREEKLYFTAQQQFRTLQNQYKIVRGQIQRNRSKLGEILDLLGKNSTGGLQRQNLESESQRLSEQVGQAEKVINGRLNVLDESSEMTHATVGYINAQNTLAIMLLDIRRQSETLPEAYKQLDENEAVQSALSAQTSSKSLGPMENYSSVARRLQRLESQVFSDGVPFYRRSKQVRIPGILNECQPVTFSYTGPSGPTLLPASALASLNMDLSQAPAGTPVEGDQGTFPTRRVVLSSLRIGQHVWQNAIVNVLPPEAEYLGARISTEAFGGKECKLEESNLWFRIQDREQP